MKKRLLSALLCTIMIFTAIAIPAQARWTNCASIELAMTYSNGIVTWTGSILGHSDTTKITASYTLEKLGSNGQYTLVGQWTNLNTTRSILNSSGTVSGTSGTYRLKMTGTVQTATYSEPISSTLVKTF